MIRLILAICLSFYPLSGVAQLPFGYGPCCNGSMCGDVPCDESCAGPAIIAMGESVLYEFQQLIESAAPLVPGGKTGLRLWMERYLGAMDKQASRISAAYSSQATMVQSGVDTLRSTWKVAQKAQTLALQEQTLDLGYGSQGQTVDCNCDRKESAALALKIGEYVGADLHDRYRSNFYALSHDKAALIARSGKGRYYREALALTTDYSLLPLAFDLSDNEAQRLSYLAATIFAGVGGPAGLATPAPATAAARDLAYAAFIDGIAMRQHSEGERSYYSQLLQAPTERVMTEAMAARYRLGSARWLASESVYLDAESAALSEIIDRKRGTSVALLALLVKRGRP